MKQNSIGNDIVALKHISVERTRQENFYSKFLTTSELDIFTRLQSLISFEQFAWLCWSIKEAVYKFQKRLQPQLLFGYKKIIVQQIDIPFNQVLHFTAVIEKDFLAEENCFKSIATIGSTIF